ncbi:hypothetical protein ACWEKM_27320 [Streptomyces sp. NPDC004752]
MLAAGSAAGCALVLLGAAQAEAADPAADLAITMSGPDAWFLNQGALTYQITVTNNGPDAASGWTVKVPYGGPIPDGANPTVVGLTTSDSRCTTAPRPAPRPGTNLVCSGGSLAAGASEAINVVIGWRIGVSSVGIDATVEGQEADPNTSNNNARHGTSLVPPPPPVDVPMIDPRIASAAAASALIGGAVTLNRRRARNTGQPVQRA